MGALWILKAYDQLPEIITDYPAVLWARDDPAWLKSQSRKQMMQYWHLPDYWRKHGFPLQCRPISESAFECN
jgi:hypothetical protein